VDPGGVDAADERRARARQRHDLRIGVFESDEVCGGDLDADP
jgi:hypothetical protein